jgi:uncharacterized membrane protein
VIIVEKQSRWRSPVLWASVIGQIVSLIVLIGLDKQFGIDTGKIGEIAAIVLQVLTTFGILNNPTSKTEF